MWNCVLTPASGCITPNCNSETNISQGKADYTIVNTIFHYVWLFYEYKYIVLYNKVEGGMDFMKGGKRYAEMFLGILSDFDVSWTTKKKKDSSSIVETVHVLRVNL
jgi:hypothetical protein